MKQFPHGSDRIRLPHLTLAMHRLVAEFLQQLGLVEKRRADRLAETRLVDQRAQFGLIGKNQAAIIPVHPIHRQLQRAPGIKAGRAGIGIGQAFRLRRAFADLGPFGLDEGEVGHDRAGPFSGKEDG